MTPKSSSQIRLAEFLSLLQPSLRQHPASPSYQHHVERISQDISGSGSEIDVCLAVRIEPQMVPHNILDEDKEEQEEDDTETDAFLSENGFEYIIATEERSKQDNQEDDEKDSWSEGIPGLSRVLDALSTIMWPSMQPRTKDNSSKKQERERALLDWAHSSQDNSLPIIDSEAATALSNQEYQRTRSMKLEMEELARWLDEDESLRDDPWKSAANSGALSSSPTIIEFGDATPQKETNEAAALGFDDDFTVFVSAPAIEPSGSSGRTTPDGPPGGLSVASMGDLYRSLGSVSDFGGSDDGRDGDLNDEDLPSKEEILATSSRIFGSAKLPLPPNIDSKSTTAKTGKTFAEDDDEALPSHKKLQNSDLDSLLVEGAGYDMEPFDLSKVLSALQEMKAEIASMEDEGERRKAAAKVALGLVYGLEADTETL
ncbi:hypothetical protein H0H81_003258 [Sphagnurus paluster]|uniref:Uncharacterized protein n=1 Tax=Sphagnurus paluster TaxID=117069 RepID=A0A9P7GN59_9AGAR|nr:hypothetical protein H0H81_003258 [Sphagnurus paluster]